MMIYNDQLNKEATEESFAILKDKMEVNVLTDQQRKVFIKQAQKVYDYYIERGFFTESEINVIRNAVN
jgi:hypothetical protein